VGPHTNIGHAICQTRELMSFIFAGEALYKILALGKSSIHWCVCVCIKKRAHSRSRHCYFWCSALRLKGEFFLRVFSTKDAFSLSLWLQFRTSAPLGAGLHTPQGKKSHFPKKTRACQKYCFETAHMPLLLFRKINEQRSRLNWPLIKRNPPTKAGGNDKERVFLLYI